MSRSPQSQRLRDVSLVQGLIGAGEVSMHAARPYRPLEPQDWSPVQARPVTVNGHVQRVLPSALSRLFRRLNMQIVCSHSMDMSTVAKLLLFPFLELKIVFNP